MPETYRVQLPGGRTITKEVPDGATDAQVRAAFAKDFRKLGRDARASQVQRPTPEQRFRATYGDQGYISKPDFNLSNTIEDAMGNSLGRLGIDGRYARHVAGRTMAALNDATPVGTATAIDEGGHQVYNGLTRGDLGTAGLGALTLALSILPGTRVGKRVSGNVLGKLLRDESGAIRAWHGSPHDFDRFDMSKIGSGEGAQAYGHGLYFAENRNVADGYRRNVSDARLVDKLEIDPDVFAHEAHQLALEGGQLNDSERKLLSAMQADDYLGYDYLHQALRALNKNPKNFDIAPELIDAANGRGRLYEVNINAEPQDFLDWDAQLQRGYHNPLFGGDLAGMDRASGPQVSQALASKGIPGIRYLDQGSRNALGNLTHNYVVFDDKLIDILNKY